MSPTKFAKTSPSYEALIWAMRYSLGSLAVAVVALSVAEPALVSTASKVPTQASDGPWGSGVVTASLIELARNERPMPGVEPTIATVLASGVYVGFVPALATASSFASR